MNLKINRASLEPLFEKIIKIVIEHLDDPQVDMLYSFDCKVELMKLLEKHEWIIPEDLRWEVITHAQPLYSCSQCNRKFEAEEPELHLFVADMIFHICKNCVEKWNDKMNLPPKDFNDPSYGEYKVEESRHSDSGRGPSED